MKSTAQVRPVVALTAAAACGMTAAVPAYFYSMSLPKAFIFTDLLKVETLLPFWKAQYWQVPVLHNRLNSSNLMAFVLGPA